jgi:hypothetical protein
MTQDNAARRRCRQARCVALPARLTARLNARLPARLPARLLAAPVPPAAAPLFACPAAEPVEAVDPALVRDLVNWIAAPTAYDPARTRDDPPEVLGCATGDAIDYEGHEVVVDAGLRAAYGALRRQISLVGPWSADRPEDVARLLHELVHDVQFLNADWPCPRPPSRRPVV